MVAVPHNMDMHSHTLKMLLQISSNTVINTGSLTAGDSTVYTFVTDDDNRRIINCFLLNVFIQDQD